MTGLGSNGWCDRAPMIVPRRTGNGGTPRSAAPWIDEIHNSRDQGA